jgi:hypothetical protein
MTWPLHKRRNMLPSRIESNLKVEGRPIVVPTSKSSWSTERGVAFSPESWLLDLGTGHLSLIFLWQNPQHMRHTSNKFHNINTTSPVSSQYHVWPTATPCGATSSSQLAAQLLSTKMGVGSTSWRPTSQRLDSACRARVRSDQRMEDAKNERIRDQHVFFFFWL